MRVHSQLAEALRAIVPDGAYAAEAGANCESGALIGAESRAVTRAVPQRVAEFTGGRIAARRALAALGIGAVAISADESRMPLWPAGVVGSISHSGGWCIAVVASAERHRSVGVDIESATSLAPHLWSNVCTSTELAWLGKQPSSARGTLAKVLFSVKESVYKWQYPLTRTCLGFRDVRVEYLPEIGLFQAQFIRAPWDGGVHLRELRGRVAAWSDKIVTAVVGE